MNQMLLIRDKMIRALTTGEPVLVCVDKKIATIAADVLLGNVELEMVPVEEYDSVIRRR